MIGRRWRGGSEREPEPDGSFRRLTGHIIAWIYIVSGAFIAGYAPTLGPGRRTVLVALVGLALGTVVAGVFMLRLPWHRWPRQRQGWAAPLALAISGLGNWVDPNPYLAAVSFFLVAMWAGVALRRGTVLVLCPLFAAAYWVPLALVPHPPGLAASALVSTGVCVFAGESMGWLTARLHALQARLRKHDERRFQALVAASSDTTILLDAAGRATYLSPPAERLFSRSVASVEGRPVQALIDEHVHPDDASEIRGQLVRLYADRDSVQEFRLRLVRADGSVRDIEGVGRNLLDDEAVRGVLVNLRDVTERVELERALVHQAFSDPLTGLPNRRRLRDLLGEAILAAEHREGCTALLLADLNQFKDVNDTLGHHYGDMLLGQVAARLGGALRATDTVARLGGDEFAVLLPDVVDLYDAASVATKLRAALDEPFVLDELVVAIEAGIGIAMYPDHATDPDDLLRKADVAMYAAKAAHVGCQVFQPRLDRHSARKLALLGRIRTGIAEGEMVLHYQPKVDVRTVRPLGVEALVRWQHPEYGLLGPGEFVPLAETTGLIRPLTFHVLELALHQQRSWLDAGSSLSVAVNLSTQCLLDPTLPAQVERLLRDAGVPPRMLVLEITESAVMSDPTRAYEILRRLRDLGVRLSIDDFGTGYSSMGRLKDLPADELKVDRSFVMVLRNGRDEETIVRSIIDLGHNLGLKVVAEGIEDAETWAELDRLGCDILQGYYIAKPMPAEQVPGWLDAWAERRGPAAVPQRQPEVSGSG